MKHVIVNHINDFVIGALDIFKCRKPKDVIVWYATNFVDGVEYYDVLSLHSRVCYLNGILNHIDFALAFVPVIAIGGFVCYKIAKNHNK